MRDISEIIKNKFNLEIPIFAMTVTELDDILNNSPNWWVKTASTNIRNNITIRTANTMKKIIRIM